MTVLVGGVYFDVMFSNLLHECCAPFCLLFAAITNDFVWHPEISNKLF